MALITVQFTVRNGTRWPGSNHKPYQEKLDDLTKRLPGYSAWQNDRVVNASLTGDDTYEVVLQNNWFVADTFLKLKYTTVSVDDGQGIKHDLDLLTDISCTVTGRIYGSNGNPAYYNPYGAPKQNYACNHEAVDVGFNLKNLICKHCNKDMN
jgi:hypothetical protein